MKNKLNFLTLVLLLTFLMTGCDIIFEQFPPFNETQTIQPTNTNTIEASPQSNTPTHTKIPPSPTSTFTLESGITDTPQDPTEDVLGTVVALQETLDAASAQISTLEAEKTSSPSGSSGSSGSNTATPEFELPSNVRVVTIIHRANLRISKRTNDAGKPVMSMPSPRIILDEGSIQYIYNKRVDADGDVVFYEIWDPDGVVTQVLYIRAVDIQFRTSKYNTAYGPIPEGVVFGRVDPQAVLRYIKEYNTGGRPIMRIKEPRVVLLKDVETWIYPEPVLSDGGNLFYEIYDPDGNVSTVLFARISDLIIPNALQQ
ncbi:MAG: hypothetical protein PVF83_18570 [Anaerolineales bacterium]|jgi:hypothetical protein